MWLKITQNKNSTVEKDCINLHQCRIYDDEWRNKYDTTLLTYVDRREDNEQVICIHLDTENIVKIEQLKTPSAYPLFDKSVTGQLHKYFDSIYHPLHPFNFKFDEELGFEVAKVRDVLKISDEDVENELAKRFSKQIAKIGISNMLEVRLNFKDLNGYMRSYLASGTCKHEAVCEFPYEEGHRYSACIENVVIETTMKKEFFSKEAIQRLTKKINENEDKD